MCPQGAAPVPLQECPETVLVRLLEDTSRPVATVGFANPMFTSLNAISGVITVKGNVDYQKKGHTHLVRLPCFGLSSWEMRTLSLSLGAKNGADGRRPTAGLTGSLFKTPRVTTLSDLLEVFILI